MPVVVKKKVDAAQSKPNDQPGAVISFPAAMANGPQLPQYSDEALALRFADRHATNLRYVAEWDQWFFFDGRRWQEDKTLTNIRFAREVCRLAAAECCNMPTGTKVGSSATVYAVQRLARADKRIAATVDQWDSDPFLLNTPDFLIDLRTGKPRERTSLDYCTKMTAVSPGGHCPVWLQFLAKIFAANEELIEYVQRLAGYALTGSTEEHALFFCYGTGANGKSTMLNALAGVIGDYSAVASLDTFTASHNDRHPTELAVLRGARMVTASETEEGRRWAEARIKAITGGDPITARRMRRDPFTFKPQLKLVMAGNHKPGLGSVDEAIRRRFHLIPFEFTVPEKERDPGLAEKLHAEWPGILAWMIQGCLKWRSQKLNAPAAVTQATDTYLESEDALGQWLEEFSEKGAQFWEASSALYASWKSWADKAGKISWLTKALFAGSKIKDFQAHKESQSSGLFGSSPEAGRETARWS